ncbi:MAG: hypothetical protein VKK04_20060 [Synechococcales bacterium]|nr:hypothetical protein [Synechococcales bacterium]
MYPESYSAPFVNPPVYTLIMVSTFLAVTWGIIFKDMLEYQVNRWNVERENQSDIHYRTPNIITAYLGVTFFVTVTMGASLSIFGLPTWFAYLVGAIVVVPTALLVWLQLGSMLKLLVIGGSEAMDIDSYGAGAKYDPQAAKAKAPSENADPVQ